MEGQRDEQFKKKKVPKTAGDAPGKGKLIHQPGLRHQKKADQDENCRCACSPNGPALGFPPRKAEVRKRFFQNEYNRQERKNKKKKKRAPKGFAEKVVGENQTDKCGQKGAKADQYFPLVLVEEVAFIFCLGQLDIHKIYIRNKN